MRLKSKRLVSLLLAGSMMVSMVPASAVTAFAAETKSVVAYTGETEEVPTVTVSVSGGVQAAVQEKYSDLDAVTKLIVKTENGATLNKDDFQFLSGVVVAGDEGASCTAKYAGDSTSGLNITYLKNLEELDLTDAQCENNTFPPRAFCGNTKIKVVIFPNTLQSSGFKTFVNASALEYVGTREGLGASSETSTIKFPASMTKIGESCFYNDPNLKCTLELPATVTTLGTNAFWNTPIKADKILIRNTVTFEAPAPGQTSTEHNGTFYGTDIKAIEFEEGITKIPANFVANCWELNAITIPSTVTEIGVGAFNYAWTKKGTNGWTAKRKTTSFSSDLVIPEKVTTLGSAAIDNIGTVPNIIVENPNVSLGQYCFYHQSSKIYFTAKNIENANDYWDNDSTRLFTDGGKVTPNSTETYENTGLYIPVKEGYKFVGWYDADGNELTNAAVVGKTYTAKWKAKEQYTVTFDLNGHGDNTTQTVYEDDPVTKPTDPTEKGYKFAGWYADAECKNAFDFTKPITENTTVYAKWEEIPDHQLTVVGGTFTVKDETVETKTEGNKLIADVPEGAEVTVAFNKDFYADSNLVFGGWMINGLDNAENYTNKEEFNFIMPENGDGVTIEAQTKTADTEDDSWDAATIVAGVAVGAGAAVLTYHIGTELYAEQVLGKGVAVPKTRADVALKAWELAGKPAVALSESGEPLSEAAQAEKWVIESGLMQNVDGSFNGTKKMNKLKALRVLDAAKKLNAQ